MLRCANPASPQRWILQWNGSPVTCTSSQRHGAHVEVTPRTLSYYVRIPRESERNERSVFRLRNVKMAVMHKSVCKNIRDEKIYRLFEKYLLWFLVHLQWFLFPRRRLRVLSFSSFPSENTLTYIELSSPSKFLKIGENGLPTPLPPISMCKTILRLNTCILQLFRSSCHLKCWFKEGNQTQNRRCVFQTPGHHNRP